MPHPLVTQLRFSRSEFVRCLDGVSEEDGRLRLEPMNCIGWIVGHLAHQENAYWVLRAQGQVLAPGLRELVGWGSPASTPSLEEMWDVWRTVTGSADRYLDTVTPEILQTHLEWEGEPLRESVGTMLLRNTHRIGSRNRESTTAHCAPHVDDLLSILDSQCAPYVQQFDQAPLGVKVGIYNLEPAGDLGYEVHYVLDLRTREFLGLEPCHQFRAFLLQALDCALQPSLSVS